jgi:hypothetical protein
MCSHARPPLPAALVSQGTKYICQMFICSDGDGPVVASLAVAVQSSVCCKSRRAELFRVGQRTKSPTPAMPAAFCPAIKPAAHTRESVGEVPARGYACPQSDHRVPPGVGPTPNVAVCAPASVHAARMGTRQSRRCRIPTALLRVAPAMWRLFQLSIMFVIGLMPESANDNSPLPAALIISYVAGELSPPPKASWRSEGPIRCSQSAWCRPHHAQTTALWGHQM